jgi:hypothetical protein
LPFLFDAAVELSPPGWTREASARPLPAHLLPPTSPILALDQPTAPRLVLIIGDSAEDVEETDARRYLDDEDDEIQVLDPRIDWDSLLDAALAELGLQTPRLPDWFWYRSGTP